jgi:hypothetical protein
VSGHTRWSDIKAEREGYAAAASDPETVQQAARHRQMKVILRVNDSLLELFSVVDDVFTEENALAADNRAKGLGRIYRAWKQVRADLGGDEQGPPPVQTVPDGQSPSV